MPPRPISRSMRYSAMRSGGLVRDGAVSGSVSLGRGLRSSINCTAGKTSRISSAKCGNRSVYSSTVGRSPERRRWANSSVRSSNVLSLVWRSGIGRLVEDVPQAHERTDMSFARGVLCDVQHLRDLTVSEFLKVAQGEDFAVEGVHFVEGGAQAILKLVADCGLARRRHVADQLPGHRFCGRERQLAVRQRDLGADGAHPGPEVHALEHLHPLNGEEAEPDVDRNGRIGQVFADTAGHVKKGFLKHVVRCEAGGNAAIKADVEHTPEPVAVPVK